MTSALLSIHAQIIIVNKLIRRAENSLRQKPKGCLVTANHGSYYQWYFQEEITRKRKYLPKKEIRLAKALAQKEYDRTFLKTAGKLLQELDTLSQLGAVRSASVLYGTLADVYTQLSPERRRLVDPYVLPDEQFAAAWLREPYEGKVFLPDTPEIYTEKGERVRSKSEKMIADKLALLGIPYRYEYPLTIPGIGHVNPDFLLLDLRERTTVLYEHFGLMQDPDYCRSALRKIDAYEKNGLFPGREFLCTFESEDHVLDMTHFEKMMRERFL